MIRVTIIFLALCFSPFTVGAADCNPSDSSTQELPRSLHESDASLLQFTFDTGSRWEMCWHVDEQAGLVLSRLFYGAPNEPLRQVLDSASVAQILFKYDKDVQALHLLSDEGLGGPQLLDVAQEQCRDGEIRANAQNQLICTQVRQINHLNKLRVGESRKRHELSLQAWSKIGTHIFQQTWRLSEDGEIAPAVIFSGRMNQFTTDSRFGIKLRHTDSYAASATLLVNWRLDFNINSTPHNDLVDEIEFPAIETDVVKRPITIRQLSTETSRTTRPEYFRGWRVADAEHSSGDANGLSATTRIGYYLDPQAAGYSFRSPTENWAESDFHLTTRKACEKLASANRIAGSQCADNLDDYVNNESLAGADTVVWFSLSRRFTPTLEDFPAIAATEISFKLMPFDWSAHTPFSPPE